MKMIIVIKKEEENELKINMSLFLMASRLRVKDGSCYIGLEIVLKWLIKLNLQ